MDKFELPGIPLRTTPISVGLSGARVEHLEYASGEVLVRKKIRPASDWLMQATRDDGREPTLFSAGVLDALPRRIHHAVVGIVPVDQGWDLYMHDVTAHLLTRDMVDLDTAKVVLSAIDEMCHIRTRPPVTLCTLRDRYAVFAPGAESGEPGLAVMPSDLRGAIDRGWANLDRAMSPLVRNAVVEVMNSPEVVELVFDEAPATLVHGDLSPENVAIIGDTVTLLDWGSLTMWAPGALDAAGVFLTFPLRDEDREDLLEQYVNTLRNGTARLAFEIALLAEFSMIAPQLAFTAESADSQAERMAAASCLGWWDLRLRESAACGGRCSRRSRTIGDREGQEWIETETAVLGERMANRIHRRYPFEPRPRWRE